MHPPAHPRARAVAVLALTLTLAAGCSPGGGEEGGPGDDGPRISVEPLTGPPRADVQVRVTGFPPDVVVDVGFGAPDSAHEVIARTSTGGDGSTAAAVKVPARAVPGRPYVFTAAYPPSLLRLVSDTFTVTAAGTPVPAGDTAPGGTMGTGTQGDAAARAGEVRVTGRLTDEGVECPALRGDDGMLYTLTGDTAGFRPGDRVTVTGEVAEMSICMQGTTIGVRTIERA